MTGAPGPQSRWFDDLVIVPFTDLIESQHGGHEHRGGPLWPAWERQLEPRYLRGNQPQDVEPAPLLPSETLEGEIAWGGPMTRHFGRQLADFSMRLVPTVATRPDIDIVFATHPRFRLESFDDVPAWFRQVLDWIGVAEDRRRLLVRPTRVRSLLVAPQAEQNLGPGPSSAHLDAMDAISERHLGDRARGGGVVYISRAGMHARFAGEAAVEAAMARAGARVIRPETASVIEQLTVYSSADALLFAEGSAVHGCRLLGRSLGDIVIIERRPGNRIDEPSLRPRASAVEYVDHVAGIVHGATPSGRDFIATGLAVLDGPSLVEGLTPWLPSLRDAWDETAYRRERDADVLAWVDRTLQATVSNGLRSRDRIGETLEETGLGHLRMAVTALMNERPPAPSSGGR